MSKTGDYRVIQTAADGQLKAGEDLEQHDLVYINTTPTPSTIEKTTAETSAAIGVVGDEYSTGDIVAVKLTGTATCRAVAAVDVGDKIVPAADGEAGPDDGTAAEVVVGVAETAASAANALFEVFLAPVKAAN